MARIIFPPRRSRSSGALARRDLAERLARSLGRDWSIHALPLGGPGSDGSAIDAVLISETHGVAVLSLLPGGSEEIALDAADAFRSLLLERGFFRRFSGRLPIIGIPVPPSRRDDPGRLVADAFAGTQPPTLGAGWAAALRELLGADAAPEPSPLDNPAPVLRPPARGEAWRVTPRASEGEAPPRLGVSVGPEDHVVRKENGRPLLVSMALAICVVLAVLAGMALLSGGHEPAPNPTDSQAMAPRP